jgi:hypothetical protein
MKTYQIPFALAIFLITTISGCGIKKEVALPNANDKSIGSSQPVALSPKSQFLNRRVSIIGTVDMHDDDPFLNGEDKIVPINTTVDVNSSQGGTYNWQDCVDKEVRGEYRANFKLDKDTGVVSVKAVGQYYEGASCDSKNLKINSPSNVQLDRGQEKTYSEKLSDDSGHVIFNLTFKNLD